MKIRMKTSSAGRQQANIIHMGKFPSEPRGWMSQPRLEGLVTEKPLGTLSFCTKNELMTTPRKKGNRVREIQRGGGGWGGGRVGEPHLNEGVAEVGSHQDHDEDCNGNAEISNNPPQLTHTHTGCTNECVLLEPTENDIVAANVELLTLPGKNALFLNLRR